MVKGRKVTYIETTIDGLASSFPSIQFKHFDGMIYSQMDIDRSNNTIQRRNNGTSSEILEKFGNVRF